MPQFSGPPPSEEPSGHRTKAELAQRAGVGLRATVIDHGPPSPLWSVTTRDAWETFWTSIVAHAAEPVDLHSIRRMFDYIDRQQKMWEIVEDEGYVVASERGGDRAHPLIASIASIEKLIDRLESQFGVRPYSRMRLGLKVLDAAEAHAKVQRAATNRGRVLNNGKDQEGAAGPGAGDLIVEADAAEQDRG